MSGPTVLWFRHGLRIHDNPALLDAIKNKKFGVNFIPIFIFSLENTGTQVIGYNQMKFLLESLFDLNEFFKSIGGRLYMFQGNAVDIFRILKKTLNIQSISYEQDCEPIWRSRDSAVEELCSELGIRRTEYVSHTLWDPNIVIKTNGGIPPLTYAMFLHTVKIIGPPPRPVSNPNWNGVNFVSIPEELSSELNMFRRLPCPEDFNLTPETSKQSMVTWRGGEKQALINLDIRLDVEENAFKRGYYLPNQAVPNILDSPKSMSAHISFGCLSVRKFYWDITDLFHQVNGDPNFLAAEHITGQLIWREYFYTMSVRNPYYAEMERNPICLNIPWAPLDQNKLEKWQLGKTGFPLIDAAMRQLLAEGWLHHVLRNIVATFLTRGGLWLSWEHGLAFFLKYLLDADWSVCAGNWIWVSSSGFEKLLDSSQCTCPFALGKRLDPDGEYIKRYVPELRNIPEQYIHQPWLTPKNIQHEIGCVIGEQYPERIIDLPLALKRNKLAMQRLRENLNAAGAPSEGPPHCRPSNEEEICQFFWITN